MASEFDLESYISNYTGHTKIDRLLFIADVSEELRTEALLLAASLAKQSPDTTRYLAIMDKLSTCHDVPDSPNNHIDHDWVQTQKRLVSQEQEKLESELAAYQNSHIRESVRVCCCCCCCYLSIHVMAL
jgi:COP9 signalosome complex subunit 1